MIKHTSLQSIYIATALTLISACGKGNTTVVAPPLPPPVPQNTNYNNNYNNNNSAAGCVGGVNTQNTFVNFGGSYDVVRVQYMPAYQCMYGTITLATAVAIGSTNIAAGAHSWQDIYDLITTGLQSCSIYGFGSSLNVGFWGAADYQQISGYYTNHHTSLGACAIGNSAVTFQRPNMTSDFNQILMLIAQMNSTYYSSLYNYGDGPYYYGPQQGYLGGTNVFGGLSYNGSGLSFSLGGSYSH